MNSYTSETIDFFVLVLTSGIIATTALVVVSLIAFTVAFLIFRERPVVVPAHKPATAPMAEPRPATAITPAAVAG